MPGTAQTLRPFFKVASKADIPILLELMQEYYQFAGILFDEQNATLALEKLMRDQTLGYVWLVRHADEPAGYVALTPCYSLEYGGREGFIDELYIRPTFRGRGLGRKAVELVEGVCRSLGFRALHFEVRRLTSDAQAFYRRVGFEPQERYQLTKLLFG